MTGTTAACVAQDEHIQPYNYTFITNVGEHISTVSNGAAASAICGYEIYISNANAGVLQTTFSFGKLRYPIHVDGNCITTNEFNPNNVGTSTSPWTVVGSVDWFNNYAVVTVADTRACSSTFTRGFNI